MHAYCLHWSLCCHVSSPKADPKGQRREHSITALQAHTKPTPTCISLALQCLTDHGLYESQAEALLREEVLGQLHSLMLTWIGRVAEIRGECELLFDPLAVAADIQANVVCSSCSSVLRLVATCLNIHRQ